MKQQRESCGLSVWWFGVVVALFFVAMVIGFGSKKDLPQVSASPIVTNVQPPAETSAVPNVEKNVSTQKVEKINFRIQPRLSVSVSEQKQQ